MAISTASLRECPDADALKAMACADTGLDDFGDPARHAGLEAFIAPRRNLAGDDPGGT